MQSSGNPIHDALGLSKQDGYVDFWNSQIKSVNGSPPVADIPARERLELANFAEGPPWNSLEENLLTGIIDMIGQTFSAFADYVKELRNFLKAGRLVPMSERALFQVSGRDVSNISSRYQFSDGKIYLDRWDLFFYPETAPAMLIGRIVVATAGIETKKLDSGLVQYHGGQASRADTKGKVHVRSFWKPWEKKLRDLGFDDERINMASSYFYA